MDKLVGNFLVSLDVGIDGTDGVHDGGVIAATEIAADFFQRIAGVPAGQVHADLAGESDGFVPLFALEIGDADVVILGDGVADHLDGDALLFGGGAFAQGGARQIHVDDAIVHHVE